MDGSILSIDGILIEMKWFQNSSVLIILLSVEDPAVVEVKFMFRVVTVTVYF